MSKKESKIDAQRVAIGIASGVGILACFLPWASLPIVGSISGAKGDGWIYAGILLVPILIAFLGDKTKALDKKSRVASGLIGAFVAVMGFYMISNFNEKIESASKAMGNNNNPFSQLATSSAHIDFGLYLLVIASVALMICAFISGLFNNKTKENKAKEEVKESKEK